MRFGVYVPTFGEYDVRTLAGLAREAEASGWDGFFIWDHLAWTPDRGQDLADTTVALTATNREAGSRLFLSAKTIEAHLGRIYRKVGVRSRTELAALVAHEGLGADRTRSAAAAL